MFFDSSKFKTMEAGVNLAWMQQKINTQNIANVETPGYKSKSLSFESVLSDAKNDKDGAAEVEKIDVSVNTSDAVSTRADGNNVDSDTEYLALYKAYAKYSMLLGKVNTEFSMYNSVINANM